MKLPSIINLLGLLLSITLLVIAMVEFYKRHNRDAVMFCGQVFMLMLISIYVNLGYPLVSQGALGLIERAILLLLTVWIVYKIVKHYW